MLSLDKLLKKWRRLSSPAITSKICFAKISLTCKHARQHGLGYAWVDKSCIGKSSSAEYSEAINSMYQWQWEAVICFVYLDNHHLRGSPKGEIPNCRCFGRGWTLQELLAPKDPGQVRFYGMSWNYIRPKVDLVKTISSYTGIAEDVLLGVVRLTKCPLAGQMSWAALRESTCIEDTAHCLLKIFDVNMQLLYGEGSKSFRRLQEIVKYSNNLTILTWDDSELNDNALIKLFADTPAEFLGSAMIRTFSNDFGDFSFSFTNTGLPVSHILLEVVSTTTKNGRISLYALPVEIR